MLVDVEVTTVVVVVVTVELTVFVVEEVISFSRRNSRASTARSLSPPPHTQHADLAVMLAVALPPP